MIIDCHTHAFAEKIAAKVVEQLVSYYQIQTGFNGQLEELLRVANEANLDALFLLVAATKPEQVKPAHDWVISLASQTNEELKTAYHLKSCPRIIHFGTYHPDDPNWLHELRRLKTAGVKGIKLHPEFQGIDLADRRLWPFFEELAGDFILLTHVGDPVHSPTNFSTPAKVAAIARHFPDLKIIAAHMGGYCFWEEALQHLAGVENVYFDTSSTLSYIDPDLLRQLISKHGTEKILFGSDYPLNSPRHEFELLDQIKWLNSAAKEQILGGNCQRLLELQSP